MSHGYDPRRSTSVALTEVRTVLSRARAALRKVGGPGIPVDPAWPSRYAEYAPHNGDDLDEIWEALNLVVCTLERWERAA